MNNAGYSKAELEFQRMRGAIAWSPVCHVTKRIGGKSRAEYHFTDGSRLLVRKNGDAAWCDEARNRKGHAEAHHNCNMFVAG